MTAKTKPEMIRLNIDDKVNRLSLLAARVLDKLSAEQLQKLERELCPNQFTVRHTSAGFKKCALLVGFMYVQAIKEARDAAVEKTKPLPNQKDLFTERTHA